jgi:IS1 family transposase
MKTFSVDSGHSQTCLTYSFTVTSVHVSVNTDHLCAMTEFVEDLCTWPSRETTRESESNGLFVESLAEGIRTLESSSGIQPELIKGACVT